MNLIGRDGKGESVWLAWFLFENLQLFSGLARRRGDVNFADTCTGHAMQLRGNIEANAWDGDWYRRAYFDDGTPLGSSQNDECKIDSISQSWAVISGAGDPERARLAMNSVDKHLVKREAQLVQLLAPPFDHSRLEPGYIKGYVPGVRENGGQYTHAAIWASMAFAMMGDKERAWELFAMLNPINHGNTSEAIARYKVEPYVMAADIYMAEPHTGRGGWTWYTGAAGWMYRLSIETLLGVQLEVDHLTITPCVPAHWDTYKIHYRYRDTLYHITMQRITDNSEQVTEVKVDGVTIHKASVNGRMDAKNSIPLVNDHQEHHVTVYF
jgi:cellobiose phosphorylase